MQRDVQTLARKPLGVIVHDLLVCVLSDNIYSIRCIHFKKKISQFKEKINKQNGTAPSNATTRKKFRFP